MTTNDSKISVNNPLILFHRSKKNPEEDLQNQRAFLEAHKEQLKGVQVIDYMSSGTPGLWKATANAIEDCYSGGKARVIIQSFLSNEELGFYYDLYRYIRFLSRLRPLPIYLMDCDGRLYQEVKDTKEIEWS